MLGDRMPRIAGCIGQSVFVLVVYNSHVNHSVSALRRGESQGESEQTLGESGNIPAACTSCLTDVDVNANHIFPRVDMLYPFPSATKKKQLQCPRHHTKKHLEDTKLLDEWLSHGDEANLSNWNTSLKSVTASGPIVWANNPQSSSAETPTDDEEMPVVDLPIFAVLTLVGSAVWRVMRRYNYSMGAAALHNSHEESSTPMAKLGNFTTLLLLLILACLCKPDLVALVFIPGCLYVKVIAYTRRRQEIDQMAPVD